MKNWKWFSFLFFLFSAFLFSSVFCFLLLYILSMCRYIYIYIVSKCVDSYLKNWFQFLKKIPFFFFETNCFRKKVLLFWRTFFSLFLSFSLSITQKLANFLNSLFYFIYCFSFHWTKRKSRKTMWRMSVLVFFNKINMRKSLSFLFMY